MRLVSMWVKDHFLLGTFYLNFGGKYIYFFSNEEQLLYISREKNPLYIPSFYSDSSPNLELVSCLVGKNGSGKSTLLDIIRKTVHPHGWGVIPMKNAVLIFEDIQTNQVVFRNYNPLGKRELRFEGVANQIELVYDFVDTDKKIKIESILYSPFLDLKEFYFNADNSPDLDISLERIFQRDYQLNNQKEGNNPLLEHKYENIYRQFSFLTSKLAKELNGQYNIPFYDQVVLSFRGPEFNPQDANHNTPEEFREVYKILYELWSKEINLTERQITKNIEENRKISKLWFLKELLRSIFAPLENKNDFYFEGKIRFSVEELRGRNLEQAILVFLGNHFFEKYKNVKLPKEEIEELIRVSFNTIDNLAIEDFKTKNSIYVSFDGARKIIELQKKFIYGMSRFKPKSIGFIDISPTIQFSTGEKAMLDLFSRFHFIIEEIDYRKDTIEYPNYDGIVPNHFLLLLDEGDLGFHPVWKKKYVKSIIEILPKFFEKYSDTTVQIIFTTHDPLTLSDIPNYNVTYLDRKDDIFQILSFGKEEGRPNKSFGANISHLLSDSFFVEDGLVGDFAIQKIDKTIKWLNDSEDESNPEYHEKVIEIIDEPLLKRKLVQLFSKKTGKLNLEQKVIEEQIKELRKRLEDLND